MPENQPQFQKSRDTILVVEDDADLRFIVTRVLEGCGFAVQAAESPAVALELSRRSKERIALLLTDVFMPDTTGYELADALLGERPDLKVLFMSGGNPASIVGKIKIVEGVNFIRKPFALSRLGQAVRDCLDREP